MKADDVAWSSLRQVCEQAKGVLVKRTLLGNRIITAREKRRIHGPPAHNQIYQQAQRRLIKKPASHWKEQLLAPTRPAKEHGRNCVHIEEGTMIRNEQQRSIA